MIYTHFVRNMLINPKVLLIYLCKRIRLKNKKRVFRDLIILDSR
jgi:hypothetical protein